MKFQREEVILKSEVNRRIKGGGIMRKALLLFGNEIERENLIDSAVYLQNSLGFKIYPLYIKDMSRDKIVAASTDGMMLGGRSPFIMQGWADVEKEEIEEIERDLKAKGII